MSMRTSTCPLSLRGEEEVGGPQAHRAQDGLKNPPGTHGRKKVRMDIGTEGLTEILPAFYRTSSRLGPLPKKLEFKIF